MLASYGFGIVFDWRALAEHANLVVLGLSPSCARVAHNRTGELSYATGSTTMARLYRARYSWMDEVDG
jgi:hypothetical protein